MTHLPYTHSIQLVASADSTIPAYKNQHILCDYAVYQHQLILSFNLANVFVADSSMIWHKPQRLSKRTDYLWESTCLEVFLQPKLAGCTAYVEINIAPNNQWNAYFFKSYRQPNCMPPQHAHISQPEIKEAVTKAVREQIKETVTTTTTNSTMPLANLQRTLHIDLAEIYACICTENNIQNMADVTYPTNTAWLANITAVVKNSLTTCYFAKKHPTPADFHLRDCWFDLV